jgi:hypothetical protein
VAMAYKAATLPENEQQALINKVSEAGHAGPAREGDGESERRPARASEDEPPKPPKGKALAREVDKARGKNTPSQRSRSIKELKAMRDRAITASMPQSAIAVFDWMLGEDGALESYMGGR